MQHAAPVDITTVRETFLSLKETMASRKMELDTAGIAATEEEENPGFFFRLFKKKER